MSRTSLMIFAAALTTIPSVAAVAHHARAKMTAAHGSLHVATKSAHKATLSHAATPVHKLHGQQGIDSDRATQIQTALIREHYLPGPATGEWDSTTVSAMQKFQSDQGWQTKLTPDSRALKKLGLGADYSNAINANTASFATPAPATAGNAAPTTQAVQFTSAPRMNQ